MKKPELNDFKHGFSYFYGAAINAIDKALNKPEGI